MKFFKDILNCCNLQIVFKSQWKFANVFRFKDCLPFSFVSRAVYTCGWCNYSYHGKTDRHLKVGSGEHIGILPLTFRKAKPSKVIAIRDHLLICNNVLSFNEFTILAYGHHKYILETKESLVIKRARTVLNKNTSSSKLFLFDKSFERFHYVIWCVS